MSSAGTGPDPINDRQSKRIDYVQQHDPEGESGSAAPTPSAETETGTDPSFTRGIAAILLVVGIVAILVGQHFMGSGERLRGVPWYVLGAIGIGVAAWLPTTTWAVPAGIERRLRSRTGNRLGVLVVTAGALVATAITYQRAYGRGLFDSVWDVAIAWFAGFACIAVLALWGARIPSFDGLSRAKIARWPWMTIGAMTVVLLVAIGVRMWRLSNFSTVTTGDDWFDTLAARDFRNGLIPNPFLAHVFIIPMDLAVAVRGWISRPFPDDVASYRLFSVMYGVATVVGVFLLGRRLLGVWHGIAGAAVLACMSIHIWGSRITLINAFDAFVMVFALWLLDRAMETRHRRDALGCGAILGMGLYGYWGSRVFLGIIALCLLLMLIGPNWRARIPAMARILGWILVGFGVLGAPALAFWVKNPNMFLSRATEVTGTVQPSILDRAELVFKALLFPFYAKQGTAAASFYRQDPPFLGWSIAPFLAIGVVVWIAWLVIQVRRRDDTPQRPALLLLAWIVTIAPIAQTESMGSQRFFAVMPMWALAAGTGIVIAIQAVRGILTRDRWLAVVLAAAMMLALTTDAIHQTFFVQPNVFEDTYSVRSYDLGWRMSTTDDEMVLLQAGFPEIQYFNAGAWQYLAPGLGERSQSFDVPFDTTSTRAPAIRADQVLILSPERNGETCAILAANPTAFIAEGYTRDGRLLYLIFSQDSAFDGIRTERTPAGSTLVPIARPAC